MAYGVDVKAGGLGGSGLAEGKSGGEAKEKSYLKAKAAEKAVLKKDKIITPKGDPAPADVGTAPVAPPPVDAAPAPAAMAMTMAAAPDDFGDGFDDGAGGDEPAGSVLTPNTGGVGPTTRKMTPAYLRGNVAGRMFRRHYYAGNK